MVAELAPQLFSFITDQKRRRGSKRRRAGEDPAINASSPAASIHCCAKNEVRKWRLTGDVEERD